MIDTADVSRSAGRSRVTDRPAFSTTIERAATDRSVQPAVSSPTRTLLTAWVAEVFTSAMPTVPFTIVPTSAIGGVPAPRAQRERRSAEAAAGSL